MAEDLHLVGDDAPPPEPEKPEKPKSGRGSRSRGRPSTSNVSTELKGQITGPLNELAEWLEGRDEELAGVLRESAPRIAEFLAVHAAKRPPVAKAVRAVFAKGGPFAALRAFGPLLRAMGERLGARRADTTTDELGDPDCGLDHEHDSSCYPSLRPAPTPAPAPDGPVLPDA